MVIKRDFHYNVKTIIDYFYQLKKFVGRKITQSDISHILESANPGKQIYNSFDRKFITLKFYGFVYFDNDEKFMLNEFFEEYINEIERNEDSSKSFIKILISSKYNYFSASKANFFSLIITLLMDESVHYLDQIDIITYILHYDLINDSGKLKVLINENKGRNFNEKIEFLEEFYSSNNLGNVAVPAHDSKYLFTFLENNGFYLEHNSPIKKHYYQGSTRRTVEDVRLYLNSPLIDILNGYSLESIIDEIEYNSDKSTEKYDSINENTQTLIDLSSDTNKSIIRRYKTDRKLRNNALSYAGYKCELALLKNEIHKTFPSDVNGKDYAEVHHLVPIHAQENKLFLKGSKLVSLDQISNLVVLCPMCHAKIHYGLKDEIISDLNILFNQRRERLRKNGIILCINDLLRFYDVKLKDDIL